jgi:hypothetical protein
MNEPRKPVGPPNIRLKGSQQPPSSDEALKSCGMPLVDLNVPKFTYNPAGQHETCSACGAEVFMFFHADGTPSGKMHMSGEPVLDIRSGQPISVTWTARPHVCPEVVRAMERRLRGLLVAKDDAVTVELEQRHGIPDRWSVSVRQIGVTLRGEGPTLLDAVEVVEVEHRRITEEANGK